MKQSCNYTYKTTSLTMLSLHLCMSLLIFCEVVVDSCGQDLVEVYDYSKCVHQARAGGHRTS
jgi:hypothetical protein